MRTMPGARSAHLRLRAVLADDSDSAPHANGAGAHVSAAAVTARGSSRRVPAHDVLRAVGIELLLMMVQAERQTGDPAPHISRHAPYSLDVDEDQPLEYGRSLSR